MAKISLKEKMSARQLTVGSWITIDDKFTDRHGAGIIAMHGRDL